MEPMRRAKRGSRALVWGGLAGESGGGGVGGGRDGVLGDYVVVAGEGLC